MAILTILEFPDPRLRTRAVPVETVDDELRRLIDSMFETMYAAPGIGLAATQVDVHRRFLVADVTSDRSDPHVLINPEIVASAGEMINEEGCLSVPGIYAEVKRAESIRVRYLDRNGNEVEKDMDDLLAICVQHEMDHLEGRLFVDYLSEAKRQKIRKRLIKERRQQPEPAAVL